MTKIILLVIAFLVLPPVAKTTSEVYHDEIFPKIEVVGKNLFDKNNITNPDSYYYSADGSAINSAEYDGYKIRILPNTIYTVSNQGYARKMFYDSSDNYISFTNETTFTTPSNAMYVGLAVAKTSKDLTQLEQGTVATSYEPYNKTIVELPPNYNVDLSRLGSQIINGFGQDVIKFARNSACIVSGVAKTVTLGAIKVPDFCPTYVPPLPWVHENYVKLLKWLKIG